MKHVDRSGRPAQTRFPGNARRSRPGEGPPKLEFGEHGELTPRTIQQANLTKEEEKRAREMLKVQSAFLTILDCLSYPVDPEGNVHDLSALGPTKNAIAWTLALNGFRPSGKKYIKKRSYTQPGCYADAHTWVDIRQADDAADELEPEHQAEDPKLPPDTRRLAAVRDGQKPPPKPEGWHVTPKVTFEDIDRNAQEAT